MRCIAHRGFAELAPENTLPAVRAAYERVDAVEIDVRRCGSGELVVVHDETVDRVTDATGPVAAFTAAELADLDVLDSGAGIPTLDAVLAAVPDDGLLNIELKEDGLAPDAVRATTGAGVDVLFSSFDAHRLRAVREAGPAPVGLLVAEDVLDHCSTASDLGCEAIHPHWTLCDQAVVDRAHDAGMAVNAWTVPTRQAGTDLATLGVDGIIVDTPELCRK